MIVHQKTKIRNTKEECERERKIRKNEINVNFLLLSPNIIEIAYGMRKTN